MGESVQNDDVVHRGHAAGRLRGRARFRAPAVPDVNGYTPEPLGKSTASAATRAGEAQRFVRDLDLPGQWWTLFHSKPLNSLVEKALAANPDLQAAQAALRVANENVYAQQGFLWPSIDGNFNGDPTEVRRSAFRPMPILRRRRSISSPVS